jgi:RNA polymerase sigma-70 factor (ECF subfamily)
MIYLQTERALSLPCQQAAPLLRPTAADPQPTAGAVLHALYDTYVTPVYKFIYRKVGNREDAEDLTAQVFLKAAQHLDTDRDAHSMLAWLYKVARTTITDHWRDYYQANVLSLEVLQEERGLECAAQEPTAMLEHTPAGAQAAAILAALPVNYRRVLELRFLRGYSLLETAAAMGISEANVKVLQHRAIQKAGKLSLPARAAAA